MFCINLEKMEPPFFGLNSIIIWCGKVYFKRDKIFSVTLNDKQCKGECGKEGTRTMAWLDECYEDQNTMQVYCDQKSLKSNQTGCQMEDCPLKAKYGNWSTWTRCSCLDNFDQIKTQTRQRSCTNCDGKGTTETRNCPINICEPVCPTEGEG